MRLDLKYAARRLRPHPLFAGIAALLGASALVATLVPALRATRIEPVDAIKSE